MDMQYSCRFWGINLQVQCLGVVIDGCVQVESSTWPSAGGVYTGD